MPFFSLSSSSRVLVTHHLDRCKRHLWRDAGQLVAGSDGAGQQLTLNWMVYVPPPSQRPLRVLLPSGADSLQFVA